MALPKPTSTIAWTDGTPAARTEPSSGEKTAGWQPDQRPPAEFMNWLFYNLFEWQQYLESLTDELKGLTGMFKAYVGTVTPGGLATHSSITAALAACNPGDRILVLEDQALAGTVQVTKNNIEIQMKPGVTISKSGASTGLQISASGVRLKGGRMAGFNGGADKAILVDAGSTFTMVGEMRFANNTTDIDDASGNVTSYGLTNE